MEDIKDFNAVIEGAPSPRYLLLGNGFSMGCHGGFRFGEIRETLKNQGHRALFDEFKDENPEQILRALENAEQVLKALRGCPSVEIVIHDERQKFKNAFITAIAEQHPQRRSEISAQLTKCREFLSSFLGKDNPDGAVYTLNYDLLLFWAIMRDYNHNEIAANDGFNKVDGDLKWTDEKRPTMRSIYYLHGGLLFYGEGADLYKYRWNSKGTTFDNVQNALRQGEAPLFIAGGTHHQKLKEIEKYDEEGISYLKKPPTIVLKNTWIRKRDACSSMGSACPRMTGISGTIL